MFGLGIAYCLNRVSEASQDDSSVVQVYLGRYSLPRLRCRVRNLERGVGSLERLTQINLPLLTIVSPSISSVALLNVAAMPNDDVFFPPMYSLSPMPI